MTVTVSFYSYFKDLTGCSRTTENMPPGSSLSDLLQILFKRFPKLEGMQKSALLAVGLDYQTRDYILKQGDEVSLFPPVQGG
ncbi:MAG TPA: MoaD/ThiS family protein [Verrucomicrobiae bacterium]|nr:MoaD/ThiS family protein [Verrucomicrobiae bacterium]